MDISQRNNDSTQPMARPAQPAQTAQPKFERAANFSSNNNNRQAPNAMMGSKRMIMCCVLVIVAIIILLCAGMWAHRAFFSAEGAINTGEFQAVFLTNGQVYFGKVSNVDNGYVKLTEIYYLQVQQQVQPSSSSSSSSNSQQPQVSLTKLGNELHGPEDSMYVARDQVLFWENLKTSGKVATAIKQYEQQNNK